MTTTDVAAWAIRMAELGWPVFPLRANDKRPATAHGFKDATRDPEAIRRMFPAGTRRNLGGAVPAGLIVVDLDAPEAGQALAATDRDLPTTARSRTPRPGQHLVYRLPPGVRGRQSQGELAEGVDTRAFPLGYVVLPPSTRDGRAYEWITPPTDGNIADAPGWLTGWCQEDRAPRTEAAERGEPIREGTRNGSLTSLAGAMRRRAMSPAAIEAGLLAENAARCSPPLPDREVRAIARSVSRYEPAAREGEEGALSLDDFFAYMPAHRYIFAPARDLWPSSSVNARVPPVTVPGCKDPIPASVWLDRERAVEQMTWAPGEPELIGDRLIAEGGWIGRPGTSVFNLYRPPRPVPGDPGQARPWLEHVRRLYSAEADHLIAWFAHRVQRPDEKVNHAIILGGLQGIGKDTLLEPVKRAVGPWNWHEVSPTQLMGRFNGHLKSVILRVSEARDLGDVNRFTFYDHLKAITAAPPDVLRVDEKNLREYAIPNVVGTIITTNYKSDGVFLPADDRRHFVAWSDLTKDDFTAEYWTELWGWYEAGGCGHVAAYLAHHDLATFDPKAPPPKTAAFWAIVDANRAPEDSELADGLDALGNPRAVHIDELLRVVPLDFGAWLRDRKNARQLPHRFEQCGYVPVRNPAAKDGKWRLAGSRRVVYGRHDLTARDWLSAAGALTGSAPPVTEVTEVTDSASPSFAGSTPSQRGSREDQKVGARAGGGSEDGKSVTSVTSVTGPEGYRPLFSSKSEPGVDEGEPFGEGVEW